MPLRPILLVVTIAWAITWAIAPSLAHATSCSEWNRMSDPQKRDRIDRMIEDAISGQKGRSYRVNRNAIGRCLQDNSQNLFWDFDALCSDSRTAQMNALRVRFKKYLWNCVN